MSLFQFDFWGVLLNPFVLMFVTIALGLLFGKIKFGKFSFGTSGALFVGLAIGFFVYKIAMNIYEAGEGTPGFKAATQIFVGNAGKLVNNYFFQTSLIIFVAAVGLLAAKDLGYVIRKYGAKFVVLGLLITLVGAGATYACTAFAKNTNPYAVAGVYTGAMTSSPGLASAIETATTQAEEYASNYANKSEKDKDIIIQVLNLDDKYSGLTKDQVTELDADMQTAYINQATAQVGIGHAVGYPFGVIVVILAVNFLNVVFKFDVEEEKRKYRIEMEAASQKKQGKNIATSQFSIVSFALVCFVGYLLGSLKIYMGPLGYVSLESTGGVLIAALIIGYIGKIGPLSFRMDPKVLGIIREMGLAFFLAIVGLNYGYGAVNAIIGDGLVLAVVSLVVGIISVLIGFLVGRYVFKLNWIMLSGAICGGMTSTPGLGAATEAVGSDDPGAGYGATYPFALLGMVIFTIILHKLPLL